MTKFGRNRSENFWEIDVFVGSLHANFDQNRLNVKKFAKNRVLKQTAQKDQNRCKLTRSLYKMAISKFQNFEFLIPKILKNRYFSENLYKIQNFKNFEKTKYMS